MLQKCVRQKWLNFKCKPPHNINKYISVNVPQVVAQKASAKTTSAEPRIGTRHAQQATGSIVRIVVLYHQVSRRGCHTDNTSEHTCAA